MTATILPLMTYRNRDVGPVLDDYQRIGLEDTLGATQESNSILINDPVIEGAVAGGYALSGVTPTTFSILAQIQVVNYSNSAAHHLGIFARHTQTGSNLGGYFLGIRLNTNGNHVLQLKRFTGTFATSEQEGSNGTPPGTLSAYESQPHWLRLSVSSGHQWEGKTWLVGDSEPGLPQVTVINSETTGAGLVGAGATLWRSSSLRLLSLEIY